jgi:hypothetical protein
LEKKAELCGDGSITRNKLLAKGLERLRERLSNYDVTFIEAKLDYSRDPLELFDKISRIFVTINSKGTRIRMPDLVLALVGARVSLREGWMVREGQKQLHSREVLPNNQIKSILV